LRVLIVAFLLINGLLLILLKGKSTSNLAQVGLVLLLSTEMLFISSRSIEPGKRMALSVSDLEERQSFNDKTIEAVDFVKKKDPSFFRVDKDYSSSGAIFASLSDPKAQGYFGTKSYHSFNQNNYIKFLTGMNFIQPGDEIGTRWANGVSNNFLVQSICGVKYFFLQNPGSMPIFQTMGWRQVAQFDSIRVLQNDHMIPLGSTYEAALPESRFVTLSQMAKAATMLKACVLSDEQLSRFQKLRALNVADTSGNFPVSDYFNISQARRAEAVKWSLLSNKKLVGDLNLSIPKMVFFSIPFDKGWQATVDGRAVPLEKINIGFSGLMLDKGQHHLELTYVLPHFQKGLLLSLASLFLFLGMLWYTRKK
jgi:uncharacterized membrane protein YfhO